MIGLSFRFATRIRARLFAAAARVPFLPTRIPSPSASTWNNRLRRAVLGRHSDRACGLFVKMLEQRTAPDEHTFPVILGALAGSGNARPAQFHARTVKYGFDSDSFVRNSLLSAYASACESHSAHRLFAESATEDPVGWTAMINGYMRDNRFHDGLALFLEMRRVGIRIDEVVIATVLGGCGVWFGRCVHGVYVECGRVKFDVYVLSALVDMYGKCGFIEDAKKVFHERPCRNVVCWSALITGYVQCNGHNEVFTMFQDMLGEGIAPNHITLTSVLSACAHLGALSQGRSIQCYIYRNGLELNSVSGTALIDMYAKCGCISQALAVFHRISKKDVCPWTAIISGLGMHGYAVEALGLFSAMEDKGVLPNAITFIGVLSACSHANLVDQGKLHFYRMRQCYGIKPNMKHYGCMVDLLARAGCFEEACTLIKDMPMEPNVVIWGALYGACVIHKIFSVGETVASHLIRTKDGSSGGFALLANMYSESGKWEEMANVRKIMRANGVQKAPGCSWIEVNGSVHDFIALDCRHVKSNEIYITLDVLTTELKLAGYVLNKDML